MSRFAIGDKVKFDGREGSIAACDLPAPEGGKEEEYFYLVAFDDEGKNTETEKVADGALEPAEGA